VCVPFSPPPALETRCLRSLKEEVEGEEEQLNLEKAQLLHCVAVAQQQMKLLDDSVVRKKAECDAFDRAIDGMSTAFDHIVETTDELLHIAHTLDVGGEVDVSDSDEEGGVRKPSDGPKVYGERVTRWEQQPQVEQREQHRQHREHREH